MQKAWMQWNREDELGWGGASLEHVLKGRCTSSPGATGATRYNICYVSVPGTVVQHLLYRLPGADTLHSRSVWA